MIDPAVHGAAIDRGEKLARENADLRLKMARREEEIARLKKRVAELDWWPVPSAAPEPTLGIDKTWDGTFDGACACCGDDVKAPAVDGLVHEGMEAKCVGCGRAYGISIDESLDGDGIASIADRFEPGDPRPECSCPDSEFGIEAPRQVEVITKEDVADIGTIPGLELP